MNDKMKEIYDELGKRVFIRTPDLAGRVLSFADGVATVSGLYDVRIGEKLNFEDSYNHAVDEEGPDEAEIFGIVEDIDEFSVKCLVFGEERFIKQGDRVNSTGSELKIPVSPDLLGRIVDSFCRELPVEEGDSSEPWFDTIESKTPHGNKKNIKKVKKDILELPLERPAPGITDRSPVKEPLVTGIKAIDSMLPIGKGQRMLVIGDRSTGKSAVAIDMLINQAKINKDLNGSKDFSGHDPKTVYCIYVAIGKKVSEIKQIYNQLENESLGGVNAMKYTVIVAATANDPAPLLYAAPFAACTIAEYFRDMGRNALIIYDDLSKHANAYRQISLLLKRPPGREAYPGDIFYLHSRLLERAAKIAPEYSSKFIDEVIKSEYGDLYGKYPYLVAGDGSMTAIPIVETKLGDYSSYISTNIISITDGQIFLSEELKNLGIMPAINVGLSVSRVGDKAQYPWMRVVAREVRERMAEFREKEKYKAYNPDPSEEDLKVLDRGERMVFFFRQKMYNPIDPRREVLGLFGIKTGFFDLIKLDYNEFVEFETDIWNAANNKLNDLLSDFSNINAEVTDRDIAKLVEFFEKCENEFFAKKKSDHYYAEVIGRKKEKPANYTSINYSGYNILRDGPKICKLIEMQRSHLVEFKK